MGTSHGRHVLLLPMMGLSSLLAARAVLSLPEEKVPPAVRFVDVTAAAGLRWNIEEIERGPRNLVETMGGGGGFVDYDGDGLLDLYLVAYTQKPQGASGTIPHDVLYRNEGNGRFTDVTERAGIRRTGVGMGLTVGDYDNDGRPDLYVTGFGRNTLYHNNGDGTFSDVTQRAGVAGSGWSVGAAFFDYDNDGLLDLYVAGYIDADFGGPIPCTLVEGRPYCQIKDFKGSAPRLYRNNGDGTFSDVSLKSGVGAFKAKGLGVVTVDYDGDGRPDVFQSNDTDPNFLFHNRGDGTFEEVGLRSQVAFDPQGRTRGGMGVDAQDVEARGHPDFFVANFTGETYAYFRNEGDGSFEEVTYPLGLVPRSLDVSGFGARFLDYDDDGRLDLMVLNGHPFEIIDRVFPAYRYAEPPFLFRNTGKGFVNVAAETGEALARSYPGRGLAVGDIDNDGDPDVLILAIGRPPTLLRNEGGNRNHWLGLRLVGTKSNRDGVGAVVTVVAGDRRQIRHVTGGGSYATASDRRLLFGLGEAARPQRVDVAWPSGRKSALSDVAADRYLTVEEPLE